MDGNSGEVHMQQDCDYNWAKGDLSKALFCQVTQKWARAQKVDLSEEKLWEQAGSKYGKGEKTRRQKSWMQESAGNPKGCW